MHAEEGKESIAMELLSDYSPGKCCSAAAHRLTYLCEAAGGTAQRQGSPQRAVRAAADCAHAEGKEGFARSSAIELLSRHTAVEAALRQCSA